MDCFAPCLFHYSFLREPKTTVPWILECPSLCQENSYYSVMNEWAWRVGGMILTGKHKCSEKTLFQYQTCYKKTSVSVVHYMLLQNINECLQSNLGRWKKVLKCWELWVSHKRFWQWHNCTKDCWFLDLAIITCKNKTPWWLNLIPSSSEKVWMHLLISHLLE